MIQGLSLQQIQSVYFTNNSFLAQTQAYYGSYSLSLSKPLSSYQLDIHAQMAIDYIANLPFNQANKQVFYYFLENWGTSVIIDETEGGLLQYACILPNSIWNWGGGQGQVPESFINGQAQSSFMDKMQGTTFTSSIFTESSVCAFYCSGGNSENCPTSSSGATSAWTSTIWADPQSIKYNVVPISEVISDNQAKQAIQLAIYSYYADQSSQWQSGMMPCTTCVPQLNAFLIAANIPYSSPTTVKAGTCSTAIKVSALGACFFIMYNNGSPINSGTTNCDYKNSALWGIAAPNSISNPVVEWIVTQVNQDNVFVSEQCKYDGMYCEYWTGQYSLSCV